MLNRKSLPEAEKIHSETGKVNVKLVKVVAKPDMFVVWEKVASEPEKLDRSRKKSRCK